MSNIIILIGHGGVPTDFSRTELRELMRLEGERNARGISTLGDREQELDRKIRSWPRTAETDPYQSGLEAVADQLRKRLPDRTIVVAYNEFCTPSLDEAIDTQVDAGATKLSLLTTMYTPGGSHSEKEIPAAVKAARERHPGVAIQYAWPVDLSFAAEFLARQLEALPAQ